MFSSREFGICGILDRDARASRRTALPQSEIINLLSMGGLDRHEYCIRKICEQQEIWTLFDNLGLISIDAKPEYAPIFPTEDIALDWKDCTKFEKVDLVPIPIDDFIDVIVPALSAKKCRLDVFPSRLSAERILVSTDDLVFDVLGMWEQVSGTTLSVDPTINDRFLAWGKRILHQRIRRQITNMKPPRLP